LANAKTGTTVSPTFRLPSLLKLGAMLLAVLLLFRFFDQLARVLLVLYGAAIVAVAINRIVQRLPLERRWVVALIGLSILALLISGIVFGGPLLLEQLRGIAKRAPEFEQQLQTLSHRFRQATGLNVGTLHLRVTSILRSLFGGEDGAGMMGQAKGAASMLVLPLLVLVGGLFAVANPNDKLLVPALRAVPRERRDQVRRVLDLLSDRLGSWIHGQLIAMAAVGTLATIALTIIGVPYALLLGVLNAFTEFIPIAGPWMGGVPAVAIATLDDPRKGVWTAIAMFGIQLTEMNLITPFTMSKVADVHPLVTLFALFAFGSIFGFLGMLLALPLVLLLWTVIQVFWVEGAIETDHDRIADVVEE
jgi:predicted PurR-regulated permease PerM